MKIMNEETFFYKIFEKQELIDRKVLYNEEAVDVIIPIFNTNQLFEKNLFSFYREIPINKLIIGNGGSTDDSIETLKKFPRVKIINQSHNHTLGFCIAELISNVQTEWFIYLHADVYLPKNWYNTMKHYQKKYDWYECDSRNIVMIEYNPNTKNAKRAYSGSQMGRKEAFKNIIPKIQDDFLYRNEDIIFKELIIEEQFNYGRVLDTYSYHEVMNKKGEKEPKFKSVSIQRFVDIKWEIETLLMQVKGIIKYSKPKPYLVKAVNKPLKTLLEYHSLDIVNFKNWVKNVNESWLKYIEFDDPIGKKIMKRLQKLKIFNLVYNKFFKSDLI